MRTGLKLALMSINGEIVEKYADVRCAGSERKSAGKPDTFDASRRTEPRRSKLMGMHKRKRGISQEREALRNRQAREAAMSRRGTAQ